MFGGSNGGFGSVNGGGGNVIECMEHGVIDGTGIEKEFSGDALDKFDCFWFEEGCVINRSIMDFGVGWFDVFGWAGKLLGGEDTFKFGEGIGDLVVNGAG